MCDFHNFAAEIYLFSCESNSRTSRPRSVSESLSLSVIHFNNIIITSFQPSLDTSVYVNPLWISIKTLKNLSQLQGILALFVEEAKLSLGCVFAIFIKLLNLSFNSQRNLVFPAGLTRKLLTSFCSQIGTKINLEELKKMR